MDVREVAVLLLALSLIGAGSTSAQEPAVLPPPGSYGISFRVPEGGGAGLGLRKLLSERTNVGVGLLLDLGWRDVDRPAGPQEDARFSFSVGVSPNVRLYRALSERVLPFLLVGVNGVYRNSADDAWGWAAGTELGLGVEWFPTSSVSFSGSTGIRADYRHDSDGRGSTFEGAGIRSFHSQLALNVYF